MLQAVNTISLTKARGLIGLHAHQKFKCTIYIYTYYGSPEISARLWISTWNLQMSFDVARTRTNDKVIVNIRRTHEYECIRRICGIRTTPGIYGISAEITCARKTFGRSAHNCSLILIYIELILVFISCSLPLSLSLLLQELLRKCLSCNRIQSGQTFPKPKCSSHNTAQHIRYHRRTFRSHSQEQPSLCLVVLRMRCSWWVRVWHTHVLGTIIYEVILCKCCGWLHAADVRCFNMVPVAGM